MSQLVIFDFDGTLVDSLAHTTAVIQRLAPRLGLKLPPDLETARSMPTRQLFREMGLSFWKLPRVISAFQEEAAHGAEHLRLFPAWPAVLRQLRDQGHTLGILSSNREATIRTTLTANAVPDLFAFVVGYPRLFGKAKALRRILRAERRPPEQVVYVGDETRDIDAAHRVRVRAIGVSWGYHTPELLHTARPTHLLHQPADLLQLLTPNHPPA